MIGISNNRFDKHLTEGSASEHLARRAQLGFGQQVDLPIFYRMVVIEVIFDPTELDKKAIDRYRHEVGVVNTEYASAMPRNSIIARRVLSDGAGSADVPMFLFPFFPSHLALPCKPGEHVWAIFENAQKLTDVGYWMCRIPTAHFVDDVNHTHAPREFDPSFTPTITDQFKEADKPIYEFRNGVPLKADGSDRLTEAKTAYLPGDDKAYQDILTGSNASQIMNYESIPRYRKRPGDFALEGSNNALIVIGTDRTGAVAKFDDSDDGKKASKRDEDMSGDSGAIDLVVGRGQTPDTGGTAVKNSLDRKEIGKGSSEFKEKEGDPDFAADRSRIYIAQRTKTDKNFKLDDYNKNKKFDITDNDKGDGAIVLKSDKVRIVGREDVEIVVLRSKSNSDTGLPEDETDNSKFTSIVINGKTGEVFVDSSSKVTVKATDDVDVTTDGKITIHPKGDATYQSDGDTMVKSIGKTTIDGKDVFLLDGADEPVAMGKKTVDAISDFADAVSTCITQGTAGSPVKQMLTGATKLKTDVKALKKALKAALSEHVKVK